MLADRLKALRIQNGFTQKYVAEQINITVSALSQYETGKRNPRDETLAALVHLYGTTSDYLLGIASFNHSNGSPADETLLTQYDIDCEKSKLMHYLNQASLQTQYHLLSAINAMIHHAS